jgi:hypothetical protein
VNPGSPVVQRRSHGRACVLLNEFEFDLGPEALTRVPERILIARVREWGTLVFVDCQLRWEEGKMKGSTKSAEMDEPFKCRDDTRRLGYVLFESGATGA